MGGALRRGGRANRADTGDAGAPAPIADLRPEFQRRDLLLKGLWLRCTSRPARLWPGDASGAATTAGLDAVPCHEARPCRAAFAGRRRRHRLGARGPRSRGDQSGALRREGRCDATAAGQRSASGRTLLALFSSTMANPGSATDGRTSRMIPILTSGQGCFPGVKTGPPRAPPRGAGWPYAAARTWVRAGRRRAPWCAVLDDAFFVQPMSQVRRAGARVDASSGVKSGSSTAGGPTRSVVPVIEITTRAKVGHEVERAPAIDRAIRRGSATALRDGGSERSVMRVPIAVLRAWRGPRPAPRRNATADEAARRRTACGGSATCAQEAASKGQPRRRCRRPAARSARTRHPGRNGRVGRRSRTRRCRASKAVPSRAHRDIDCARATSPPHSAAQRKRLASAAAAERGGSQASQAAYRVHENCVEAGSSGTCHATHSGRSSSAASSMCASSLTNAGCCGAASGSRSTGSGPSAGVTSMASSEM